MHISTIIKDAIRRSGQKKKDVAKKAGMTSQQLSDIIRYGSNPTTTTLRRIARALDLPEDHFLQNDGNRPDPAIRRLHFYIDLNEGETLSDDELVAVRGKVLRFAHELIDFINSQRKKD